MRFIVIILPHEREEAIEAYGSQLTEEQKLEMREAPEGLDISIEFDAGVVDLIIKKEGIT